MSSFSPNSDFLGPQGGKIIDRTNFAMVISTTEDEMESCRSILVKVGLAAADRVVGAEGAVSGKSKVKSPQGDSSEKTSALISVFLFISIPKGSASIRWLLQQKAERILRQS
jgi:hypothetical protein